MTRSYYPPGSYIRGIEIEGLFGEADVSISSEGLNDPRVLVLYGRNGTGKTTILNIVRSLLSAEDGAGHRTRLSQIQFHRAAVNFEGGMTVEAKKKNGLTGSYDWSVGAPRRVGPKIQMHLRSRGGGDLVIRLGRSPDGTVLPDSRSSEITYP